MEFTSSLRCNKTVLVKSVCTECSIFVGLVQQVSSSFPFPRLAVKCHVLTFLSFKEAFFFLAFVVVGVGSFQSELQNIEKPNVPRLSCSMKLCVLCSIRG